MAGARKAMIGPAAQRYAIPFVGREAEVAALRAGVRDLVRGTGGLIFLTGEAGIGKTRLAEFGAALGRRRGIAVGWGRCWEAGGAPPYWPWVECLRSVLERPDQVGTSGRSRRQGAALDDLLPGRGRPQPVPTDDLDPESARFERFEAVRQVLDETARERAVMVVLDDLHAADVPSLLLLRFLAARLSETPVLVVATFRGEELVDRVARTVLLDLARQPTVVHLPLRGWSRSDVATVIERSGRHLPRAVVGPLHDETDGNPLFVIEFVRLLDERSDGRNDLLALAGGLPDSIREVIARRLDRLSREARDTVRVASVLGREFRVGTLGHLLQADAASLFDLLVAAIDARLLIAESTHSLRFSHALVREVAHAELSPMDRMRLHGAAGLALERLYGASIAEHAAELASHFGQADTDLAAKAIDYARRAGWHASRLLAYEEAARWFDDALGLVRRHRPDDEQLRCDVLIELGEAYARSGRLDDGRKAFLAAAEIAETRALSGHLARAALGYGGRFVWAAGRGDRHLRPMLETALQAVGPDPTPVRARLLARLAAGPLRSEANGDLRSRLSDEAMTIARRLGDPALLAYTLDARLAATLGPNNVEQRVTLGTELLAASRAAGDAERALQARLYRFFGHLELGRVDKARAEVDGAREIFAELRQLPQRWFITSHEALLALLTGRFIEAERLMGQARQLGRAAESWNAEVNYTLQLFILRRDQGRAADVEELLLEKSVSAAYGSYAVWPFMLTALDAELGRVGPASRRLAELMATIDRLPMDEEWLFSLHLLAEAVEEARHQPAATTLYRLLRPYADANVVALPEVACGSLARAVGILAAISGDGTEAESLFEFALRRNGEMGALPWLARTRWDYGRTLLARDDAGDRSRGRALLRQAADEAAELGMRRIVDDARRLIGAEGAAVSSTAAMSSGVSGVITGRFSREGEYWAVEFGQRSAHLRDAKGLHYLSRLLQVPNREIHALDLASPASGAAGRRRAQTDVAVLSARPPAPLSRLDDQSRAEYKRRLAELQDEIDEAERWTDGERLARAQRERDYLVAELAAAYGVGGRRRPSGSPSERARLSVTRAIRASMSRITREHPALGQHLEHAVRTGTYCSYAPDPRLRVTWHVSPRTDLAV